MVKFPAFMYLFIYFLIDEVIYNLSTKFLFMLLVAITF